MCRMIAAPGGIPGRVVADAFLRMARGENALNEKNTTLGFLRHGDGWGAVVERGGVRERMRSAHSCWDDRAFEDARGAIVRLIHARLASRGSVLERNTHPFAARVRGDDWHFCHNGTLRDEPGDDAGSTDSERFFHRLVRLVEAGMEPVSAFEAAASLLRDITALNSLLLGPDGLWAFCVFSDRASAAYYTLSWADTDYGPIVSSEPLSDVAERWTSLENGTALWIPHAAAGGTPRTMPLRLPDALIRAEA